MSSINADQLFATLASVGVVLTVMGAAGSWIGRRIAASIARDAKDAATLELTNLRDAITERIDTSDDRTAEQVAELTKRAAEDRLEMAKQFGGNSGGLRQAIDEHTRLTGAVKSELANLTGRFEQHVQEGSR